ncbi:MAG: type II toxin-antitoxin system VapC family toxin [Terracidiphilus sp.]|jgi:PIN domain nuclease of toxin-antitoxin system
MTDSALLLDSNVVVWLDQRPERLAASVMLRIESAPQVFLSAVTAWELSIKQSLGALTLLRPVSDLIHTHGMTELPVTIRHGEAVGNLPLHHRDPFDRLLVAQAIVEGLILVTGDRQLLRYGVPILLV